MVLGDKARLTMPRIEQVLVGRPAGMDDDEYERRLFLARNEIEKRAQAQRLSLATAAQPLVPKIRPALPGRSPQAPQSSTAAKQAPLPKQRRPPPRDTPKRKPRNL